MNKNIENKLNKIKTKPLSRTAKDDLWQNISNNINQEKNLSIFNLLLTKNPMINIIIALLLVFGGSIATVQASDKAKLGDALYAVDRAVESMQITFASKENKDKLKVKFAEERILEMQTVIEENIEQVQKLKKIEVKIYPSEAVVKVESVHGKHFKFDLGSVDQTEIIKLIAERFQTTTKNIKTVIRFEIKDEERDNDLDDESDEVSNTEEIEESVQNALDYMIKVRNELFEGGNEVAVAALDVMIEQLQDKLTSLPEDLKIDIDIEDEGGKTEFKIELKDEDGKFKIKYKSEDNGDIKIKLENKSKDEDMDHEGDENKKDYDKDDEDDDGHDKKDTKTNEDDSDELDDDDNDEDDNDEDDNNSIVKGKIKICHKDNVEDPNSLEISEEALDTHLAHGDHEGECDDEDKDHSDEEDEEDEDNEN